MVLDGVLGDVHPLRQSAGVGARGQVPDQLRLPLAETVGADEKIEALRGCVDEALSIVTAMSDCSCGGGPLIRAARRVSQSPPVRCTRADGRS